MNPASPYHRLRQLDFAIRRLSWSADSDVEAQSRAGRKAFDDLRHSLRRAMDMMKDYELSAAEQDVRSQARLLPRAISGLNAVRDALLKVSEYDLIGAADVAQLSAQIDELTDRLH